MSKFERSEKKSKKLMVIIGVVLVLLVLAIVLPIVLLQPITNLVIGSPQFRPWLTVQVEQLSGGGQFEYGEIQGNIFRMELTDVRFKNGNKEANVKSAEIPKLYAGFDWGPLIGFQLALKDLHLVDAKIETEVLGGNPENVRVPVQVPYVSFENAQVSSKGFSGWQVNLMGTTGSVTQVGESRHTELQAATAKAGPLIFTKFHLKSVFGEGKATIESLDAEFAGGKLKLSGSVLLDGASNMSSVNLKVTNVDAGKILKTMGYGDRISGRVDVEANGVKGVWRQAIREFHGKGKVVLKKVTADVRLPKPEDIDINPAKGVPVLGFLGKAVTSVGAKVVAGNLPIYKAMKPVKDLEGEMPFELKGRMVEVGDSTLKIPDATIHVKGRVQLEGTVELEGNTIISKNLAGGMVIDVPGIKTLEDGGRDIAFRLVGSSKDPHVTLRQ